jgi:hypothetical protein
MQPREHYDHFSRSPILASLTSFGNDHCVSPVFPQGCSRREPPGTAELPCHQPPQTLCKLSTTAVVQVRQIGGGAQMFWIFSDIRAAAEHSALSE